jgi:molecular chaperone HscB
VGGAAGPVCASCGALLPPDADADHFSVLGVERRHALDAGDLEARYKDLSRKVHPDRFARADPRARRAALQRTVQLNEAWRTLKDPVRRAEYLLGLAGRKVASDEARSVPPALLMEILELREELAEARLAGDDARAQRLAHGVRAREAQAMSTVAERLAAGGAADLEAAARALVELRYFRRFLDEVAAHEESAAARAEMVSDGG